MRTRHAIMVLFFFASCATVGNSPASKTKHCALFEAVLNEVIQPLDDDIHLRTACVQQYAATAGTTWVDARIFDEDGKKVKANACRVAGYQFRFGESGDPKPAGETILLVSISAQTTRQIRFIARIENIDWPTRAPNTYALSACGNVSGVIFHSAKALDVKIDP